MAFLMPPRRGCSWRSTVSGCLSGGSMRPRTRVGRRAGGCFQGLRPRRRTCSPADRPGLEVVVDVKDITAISLWKAGLLLAENPVKLLLSLRAVSKDAGAAGEAHKRWFAGNLSIDVS